MAPVIRSRPLRKDNFSSAFKSIKPVVYNESTTTGRSSLAPNIRVITWSAAGSLIATCTHAHIRVWSPEKPNVKSSTELRNAHPKNGVAGASGDVVEKIAFCPTTENVLASTGHDGFVRLWDVRVPGGAAGAGKGTPLADCKVGDQGHFLTWHPNGTEMLVGRKDDVINSVDVRRMMSFDSPVPNYELEATERTPATKNIYNIMSFSNSGREVFASTQEGPVRILDYPSMSLLHSLSGHAAASYTVQHSPTGGYVAVGAGDSLISLWDTTSWLCTNTLTAHASSVRDLSFSYDGNYLICGSGTDARDGSSGIEVYHVDSGDVVHTVDTKNPVTQAAFHPSRYWMAYAGDPGGLHIVGAGTTV